VDGKQGNKVCGKRKMRRPKPAKVEKIPKENNET
jgi:hypothetical protein